MNLDRTDVEAIIRRQDDPSVRPSGSGKQSGNHEKANALLNAPGKKNYQKGKGKGKGKGKDKDKNKKDDQADHQSKSKPNQLYLKKDDTEVEFIGCVLNGGSYHFTDSQMNGNDIYIPPLVEELEDEQEHVCSAVYESSPDEQRYILDSGASRHTWSNLSNVSNITTLDPPIKMIPAHGRPFLVRQTGTVQLTPKAKLQDVMVLPGGNVNLVSVSKITSAGYRVIFDAERAYISAAERPDKYLIRFERQDGVYTHRCYFDPTKLPKSKPSTGFRYTHNPEEKKDNKQKPPVSSVKTGTGSTPASGANTRSKTGDKAPPPSSKSTTGKSYAAYTSAYALSVTEHKEAVTSTPATSTDQHQQQLLQHQRYGHSVHKLDGCTICIAANGTRKAITRKPYVSAKAPLETICADLVGPISMVSSSGRIRVPTFKGSLYGLIIVDEFSRFCIVRLLQRKSDAAQELVNVLIQLKRQLGSSRPILRLHSDGGTEFVNSDVGEYLKREGIRQTTTTRDKPAHNGKAERVNRTLLQLVRSMLLQANAHPVLWGEALLNAVMIYNCSPHGAINKEKPYERLYGTDAPEDRLHVFGSDVYYHLHEPDMSKIQPVNRKGAWIGWDESKQAHRILLDATGNIIITRDVHHSESSFSHIERILPGTGHLDPMDDSYESGDDDTDTDDSEDDDNDPPIYHQLVDMDGPTMPTTQHTVEPTAAQPGITAADQPDEPLPSVINQQHEDEDQSDDLPDGFLSTIPEDDEREEEWKDNASDLIADSYPDYIPPSAYQSYSKSGRVLSTPNRLGMVSDGDIYIGDQRRLKRARLFAAVEHVELPRTYAEACRHRYSEQFKLAAAQEMASMSALGVYTLVPYEKGMSVIDSRWVFTIKYDADGWIVKWKGRIVARGFTQKLGIDYFETYSPVVSFKSIRIILGLAAHYKLVDQTA